MIPGTTDPFSPAPAPPRPASAEATLPAVESERAVLKRRARELARPITGGTQSALAEHIILRIGDERYTVEAAHVREALASREITPLPGVPPTIQGIVAVHGRIVAVADLRHLLNLGAAREEPVTKLVVLEHRGLEFAVAVDELIIPAPGAVAASPQPLSAGGPDPKFLRSVTPDGLIALDLAAISSALVVNEEI